VKIALALVLAISVAHAAPLVDVTPPSSSVAWSCEPGLEATARSLAADVDGQLAELALDLPGLARPERMRVQLVRDASSLASVAPAGRGAPRWAVGVAYNDLGVISVAMGREGRSADAKQTLRHELAHVALAAALGDRAPHWLHEGFAYQHSADWSWDRTEMLAGMAWFGGIVPLEELDRAFPAEESPAQRAYAESYDFVGFLARRGFSGEDADRGDREPFRRFLGALGRGATLDAAATRAQRLAVRALFDEWKHDLTRRYLFAPVGLIGLALWIVCAVLLYLAWRRRRRQNRARLAAWDREERAHDVVAPPYIAWPGEDPLADDAEDHERDPRTIN
jgi:hypothetical protein